LTGFPGVSGIDDDLPYGKQEYVFELTPRGRALGFTGMSIGQQVRNAFEGNIATRFARDDEEIIVRVKRQQDLAGRADLDRLYLTTASGDRVPLTEVVSITERRSFSIIRRKDGVRTVAVTGDVDSEVTKSQEVLDRLSREVLPPIMEKYGITYVFKGRADETQKSFKDLKQGALLALALIYIVLGWVFASYWKPLAVMAIIPFGFVGAVLGHYVMGYNLTIISMIGLLGLSGILVNDSIVLVSRIRERILSGESLEEAAIGGARDRLRAVLLTSLTTIGGLLPLIFETSRQAQFLIPMALTLVFGLATATILVLILVPSLIGIGGDVARIFGHRGRDAMDGGHVGEAQETPTAPSPAQ
jgi:multidrug efflux pump subunit AcrB